MHEHSFILSFPFVIGRISEALNRHLPFIDGAGLGVPVISEDTL
jgi:hypothetical protein